MRRLIAVIALMALALPVGASKCYTGNIDRLGTSPILERHDPANDVTAIVGTFLWVNRDYSVAIPDDAIGYTRCGKDVTFEMAAEPLDLEPLPKVADVTAEEWNEFLDEGGDPTGFRHSTPAGVYKL